MPVQPSASLTEREAFYSKEGVVICLIESSTATHDVCAGVCMENKCSFTGSALTLLKMSELERVDGDVRRLFIMC